MVGVVEPPLLPLEPLVDVLHRPPFGHFSTQAVLRMLLMSEVQHLHFSTAYWSVFASSTVTQRGLIWPSSPLLYLRSSKSTLLFPCPGDLVEIGL